MMSTPRIASITALATLAYLGLTILGWEGLLLSSLIRP
jgi:hypothetical protein